MSNAYVADARFWARRLVDTEQRRAGGKVPTAMQRVSERSGVNYYDIWALRYRPSFEPVVSAYMRLKAAYEHEVERQEARLAHELTLARLAGINETNSDIYREAQALLRKTEGQP